jgi:hypothetical protein
VLALHPFLILLAIIIIMPDDYWQASFLSPAGVFSFSLSFLRFQIRSCFFSPLFCGVIGLEFLLRSTTPSGDDRWPMTLVSRGDQFTNSRRAGVGRLQSVAALVGK